MDNCFLGLLSELGSQVRKGLPRVGKSGCIYLLTPSLKLLYSHNKVCGKKFSKPSMKSVKLYFEDLLNSNSYLEMFISPLSELLYLFQP